MLNTKSTTSGLLALLSVLSVSALSAQTTSVEPFLRVPPAQRSALSKRLDSFVEAYRRFEWGTVFDLVSAAGRRGIQEKTFDHAMFEGDNGNPWSYHLYAFQAVRTVQVRENVYNVFGCVGVTHSKVSEEHVGAIRAVFEHDNWFFTNWVLADPIQPCSTVLTAHWEPVNPQKLEEPMSPLTCYVNLCTR